MNESPHLEVPGNTRQIDRRFREYALTHTTLQRDIHSLASQIHASPTPLEVPIIDPVKKITSGFSIFYRDVGESVATSFLISEAKTQEWWNKDKKSHGEAIKQAAGVETNGRVERITGGFSILLSPSEFQQSVVSRIYENGQASDDPQRIQEQLEKTAEAGFLLDQSEIKTQNGLPHDVHVALILDNGDERGVQRAIAHEEQEIVGTIIDTQLTHNPHVRALDQSAKRNGNLLAAFSHDAFQQVGIPALHDTAARLFEGSTHITLANVGITPEFTAEHLEQTKVLKAVLNGVRQQQEAGRNTHELSATVQGGILRPENLITFLHQTEDPETVVHRQTITDDDYKGITLQSDKEGRFVYNTNTLEVDDSLELNGVGYKIDNILAKGVMSVVYVAHELDNAKVPTAKKVIVKEVIFNETEARLAIFENEETVKRFIDGLLGKQARLRRGQPTNLSQLIADIRETIGTDKQKDKDPIGKIVNAKIDDLLKNKYKDFSSQTFEQKPDGMGNYVDVYVDKINQDTPPIDPKTGKPKIDPNTGKPFEVLDIGAFINDVEKIMIDVSALPEITELKEGLNDAIQHFMGENTTLMRLRGIDGVAGSYGIINSTERDPENKKWKTFYMIQEYVEGETLSDILHANSGKLPNGLDEALELTQQSLRILEDVHHEGVIHKDIKGENIRVRPSGEPVLIDFGIAKGDVIRLNEALIAGARKGSTLMGTQGMAAPEQNTAGGRTDRRTDVYQMGMLLFQLTTGVNPQHQIMFPNPQGKLVPLDFPMIGAAQKLAAVKVLLEQKDSSGVRTVPQEVEDIIVKAIQPDQDDRYQTADDMRKALENLIQIRKGGPPIIPPVNIAPVTNVNITPGTVRLPTPMSPLDKMGIDIIKEYDAPIHGTGFSLKHDFRSSADLPKEIEGYLAELQRQVTTDPSLLDDSLQRLQLLAETTLPQHDLDIVVKQIISSEMMTLAQKYMEPPTAVLEPASLDTIEKVLKDLQDIRPVHTHDKEYLRLVKTIGERDPSRLTDVIQRLADNTFSVPLEERVIDISELITTNIRNHAPVGASWLQCLVDITTEPEYIAPWNQNHRGFFSFADIPETYLQIFKVVNELSANPSMQQLALDTLDYMKNTPIAQADLRNIIIEKSDQIQQNITSRGITP